MALDGVGAQQHVQLEQPQNIGGNAPVGDGLGGHQAHVGEARGRGIGRMITDTLQSMGKAISNFFAKIGEMFSPRQSPFTQMVNEFRGNIRAGLGFADLSISSFTETCVQCMSDDAGVQQSLRDNLDNPDFSSKSFTGIEEHPTDSSKFIAKFGEKQLEFSDRESSMFELRSTSLKEKLSSSTYKDLREMIAQNHMTKTDSLLRYAISPGIGMLRSSVQGLSERDRDALWRTISNDVVGNTTLDQLVDRSSIND
ncbi:MAG: hypothetical protein RBR67_10105 [Desulfobacterium sp.]|jgi:hypothetical protein|nr:hypothetical protein [Desulfobacterium sp.]